MDNEVSVYFQLNENVTMTDVKTLQLAACAEAIYNPPRNSHDRTRIKETNTKRRPEPTRPRPPTPNKHHPAAPIRPKTHHTPHQRNHPGQPPTQPPSSHRPEPSRQPTNSHHTPIASHTIKLKVHQCRLKNPPICSCQHKNTTLKISHPNPKNSSAIHP